jgi:hypothetical protein
MLWRAAVPQVEWRRLSYAWAARFDDHQVRQLSHQDFLIREMKWMANDVAQVGNAATIEHKQWAAEQARRRGLQAHLEGGVQRMAS